MYMLKVCHCCDAIIGELEDTALNEGHRDVEIRGNVAYGLCTKCMMDMKHEHMYFQ